MKNNLILSFILLLLLIIGFYSEEVYKTRSDKNDNYLLNTKESLREIVFPHFHLLKRKQEWQFKTIPWPIDQNIVKNLINILTQLKEQGQITDTQQQKLLANGATLKILMNKKWREFTLAGVSKQTGVFYLKENNITHLVKDTSTFKGVYSSPLDQNLQKFLRFQQILTNRGEFLFNKDLLKILNIKELESIQIDNRRNRWFEINLLKQTTHPPPYTGLTSISLKNVSHLLHLLKIEKYYFNQKVILTDRISEISFKEKSQKTTKVRLYRGLNGEFGYFLKIGQSPIIVKVSLLKKNIFTSHVQDFWNKRIPYEVRFSELKRFDFQLHLPNQKQKIDFFINDINSFKVETKNSQVKEISRPHMNFLFNLIFNLTDFKQASWVQELNQEEIKLETLLKVYIFNKSLAIEQKNQGIMVYDLSQNLAFFFEYDTQSLGKGFFDNLFTFTPTP